MLTFHSIHAMASPVAFDPRRFRGTMERLAASGWKTVGLDDAVAFATDRKPLPLRTFVITFDDGYASVLREAAPVLRGLGFGAVLFVATNLVDRPVIFPGDALCPPEPALAWDEIAQLAASGFEIGSHACLHRDLRRLDDVELDEELTASRRITEERLGVPVRFHAYPFGACDERTASAAARIFDGAFTTRLDWVRTGDDPRLLPRLDAHYLRHLAVRGDLDSLATRSWIGLRRAGRRVRALVHGDSDP